MNQHTLSARILSALLAATLWLTGIGVALAQANSIDSFSVSQMGGKVTIRVQTKQPLTGIPPNFTVASPSTSRSIFPGRRTTSAATRRTSAKENCAA